jgi:hypothetical protein
MEQSKMPQACFREVVEEGAEFLKFHREVFLKGSADMHLLIPAALKPPAVFLTRFIGTRAWLAFVGRSHWTGKQMSGGLWRTLPGCARIVKQDSRLQTSTWEVHRCRIDNSAARVFIR